MAYTKIDLSFVSYRRGVGYRRSPGNLASRITRSIGECRMSLWSVLVVSSEVPRCYHWLARLAVLLLPPGVPGFRHESDKPDRR